MKKIVFLFMLISSCCFSQSIEGAFKKLKNTEIVLNGYNGFDVIELTKAKTDSLGIFKLNYPKNYKGAAMLELKGAKNIIVLLNNENFNIQWDELEDFTNLKFTNSSENEAFAQAIRINEETESKLSGLKYLLNQYQKATIQYKWLLEEIAYQENKFPNFIKTLSKNSYAAYYLQVRKLITDFPLTANRYIERMAQNEDDFKKINFNDEKLWSSGLMAELCSGFYQLMESHTDYEKVISHCNLATDSWIKSLAGDAIRQQDFASYCFKLLEKRSLVGASEHLAVSMFNQKNCRLSEKNTNLFEQYRKMALGNTAPNISFKTKELKNINAKYKLIVFGASECPNCKADYTMLVDKYMPLKERFNLEIVYISIDTNQSVFEDYYKNSPFITFCDGKGWDTQACKDYYVFATPTYILLDNDLKILAKLNNPQHLEAWLEAKGKKY